MKTIVGALPLAAAPLIAGARTPVLYSRSAFVYDVGRGEVLLEKNPDDVQPIASLTKLSGITNENGTVKRGLMISEISQIGETQYGRVLTLRQSAQKYMSADTKCVSAHKRGAHRLFFSFIAA
jgi:hypothetical protein